MKTSLRSEKILERLAHHPLEKKKKETVILKTLLSLPELKKAKKILFYLPIHQEVDLTHLHEKLKKTKSFILPRIKNETTLHLYRIENLEDVEIGKFGILEPKKHLKRVLAEEIDLVLVPGVAFAQNGHRIGYGKGFYDRLLKKVTCPKIGIAYEFQMVENIHEEPHDTPMDMIVTEKKIHHITKP